MELPAIRRSASCNEGTKVVSFCPMCESNYNPESARVLGEKQDSHLLHIRCGNCSNAILALVQSSAAGVSSVGLITDLGHDEVDRFREAPSVSTDDVIDIHHLLQNSQLMFSQLAA